ncbi:MAG: putative pterin-4-alpha-carbinolamine dehydratase [Frankiales bacterium]|nr:putative pterin-4-alpha-carbinolamine dehydratase [Frankiales bacterium]
MSTLLDDALIADTLESLPGWGGDSTGLWRDVHLDAEQEAEFRRQLDVDAGVMGHAPSYEQADGRTRVVLRTDDAGGVTELDVMLASHISDLLHRLSSDEPGVEALRHDEAVAIFRSGEGAQGDEPEVQTGTPDAPLPTGPLPARHGGDNTELFE